MNLIKKLIGEEETTTKVSRQEPEKKGADDYISEMISGGKPVSSDSLIEDMFSGKATEPEKQPIDEILEQESTGASTLKEVDVLMLNTFITAIDLRSAKDFVARNYSLESVNKILSVDYFLSLMQEESIPKNLFQVLNDKDITMKDWSSYFAYCLGGNIAKLAEGISLGKPADVEDPKLAYTRLKIKQSFEPDKLSAIEDYLDSAREQSELKRAIFIGNILSLTDKPAAKGLGAMVAEATTAVNKEIAAAGVEIEGHEIANIYLIKAIGEFNKGSLKEAYSIANKASELDYKNRATEYIKTLIGIAGKGPMPGVALVDDFLKEYPGYVPAILVKAKLLESGGDIPSSILLLDSLNKEGNAEAKSRLFSIYMQETPWNNKELAIKARRFLVQSAGGSDKDKIHFRMGMLSKEIGNLDEAVEELGKAFELNNSLYCALQEKAKIQRQQQKFSAAKSDLNKLISQGNETPQVFYELGLTLYEEGRFAEAYGQFKNARAKGTNIDIELFLARSLAKQEEPDSQKKQQNARAAMQHIEDARKINGNDYRLFLEEGNIHNLLSDSESAIGSFTKGLLLDAKNIELLTELGKTYYKLDRIPEAKDSFNTVLQMVAVPSQKHEISYLVAICDFQLKNYKDVVKALNGIVESKVKIGGIDNDKNQVLLYFLGESLYRLGDFNKAIAPLEQLASQRKGIEIDDEAVDLHKMLGDCYFMKNDFEMAKRSYEIVLGKRDDGAVMFNMAVIHNKEKDFSTAMKLYLQAIDKNPAQEVLASAWFDIGSILSSQKQDGKAEEAYENSLRVQPKNKPAYLAIASIHENSNPEAASKIFDRALLQFPDDYEFLHRQVRQLSLLGDNEKVLVHLDALIGKEPSLKLYEQKCKVLEQLKRYGEAAAVAEQMTLFKGAK